MASASEIASLSRPLRSGPNITPVRSPFAPRAASSRAAPAGVSTGFHHAARPRRGGEQEGEIADCSSQGSDRPLARSMMASAPAAAARALSLGQPSRGGDEAKLGEAEIGHGPRGKADILAELRLDQDHRGREAGQLGSLPAIWAPLVASGFARLLGSASALAFIIGTRCYRGEQAAMVSRNRER